MKKLLICLLTLTMVLAMGTTSVFADEPVTGSKDFGGLGDAAETWNNEGNTQNIDLEVQLTDDAGGAGFAGEARNEAYADHRYRVIVSWKKTTGTGTVNYKYYWNTFSKQYVASDDKTATVTSHPTLGVSIKNFSNAPINYKITLGEGHIFQNVLGELKVPSWAQMTDFDDLGSAAVDGEGQPLTSLEAKGTEKTVKFGTYETNASEENTTFYVEQGSLNANSTEKQTVGTVTVTISKAD